MSDTSSTLAQARSMWTELAGVPVDFPDDGVRVVVSAGSRLCPPGWAGVVEVGGAGIATAPHAAAGQLLRATLTELPVDALYDAEWWRALPAVTDVLGPAVLAYLDRRWFRPVTGLAATGEVPPTHPQVAALLAAVPAEEAGESGLDEITSPAFVVREGTRVVAAAGYRRWPGEVAHLCVLAAPGSRGRGLARTVATAATGDALAAGLLPQWRARTEASRRVARALGYRELGRQLSAHIGRRAAAQAT